MRKKIIISCLLIIIAFTVNAYAHNPIFEGKDSNFNNVITVPNHTISYSIYGKLRDKTDVDLIKFKVKKGDMIYIQTSVPIIKGNEYFQPHIAIMAPEIRVKANVPFDVPNDFGVIVIPPGPATYFHEKFTNTSYNIRQSIRSTADGDGEYYVAVYSPDRGGKYSIVIGEKEKFTGIDIAKFPFTYLRVKFFFSPIKTTVILISIVIIIAAIMKIKRLRRR